MNENKPWYKKKRTYVALIALAAALGAPVQVTSILTTVLNAVTISQ